MKKMVWLGLLCMFFGGIADGSVSAEEQKERVPEHRESTIASPLSQQAAAAGDSQQNRPAAAVRNMGTVRLTWDLVPGAVSYQFVLLKEAKKIPANIVLTRDQIFTNGYELDTAGLGPDKYKYYWSVCGLNRSGRAIGSFSVPRPLTEGIINPNAPEPTTEFDQMAYAPLYPVYSWIPSKGAYSYEVQVWKQGRGGKEQMIRDLYGQGSNIYDDAGYTYPGLYWWKVRAVGRNELPMSSWSEPREFKVTAPVTFAALGDSITHGGGAVSTPPGYLMYDWESYSAVPVKNLGFSGDTVDAMLERFDTDVLAFSPRVLVIMGGVNNFREGGTAAHIIKVLAQIRERCRVNRIVPVFVTAAPINPDLMAGAYGMETPTPGWRKQQLLLNDWIMRQLYAVDVTSEITDEDGWLRADRTTDGLHPDMEGKKYIGETIGQYLVRNFSQFIDAGKK